jgi:hypothetical protein
MFALSVPFWAIGGLITAVVSGIVVLIWGRRTLTRPATIPYRH